MSTEAKIDLARVDYRDSFDAPVARWPGAQAAAEPLFGASPAWMKGLMLVRDCLVAPWGLKTAGFNRPADWQGRVGMFRVYASGEDEIVLGEDDRHLDFRIHVRRRRDADGDRLEAETRIQLHNRLGRLYLGLVKPWHRWIVAGFVSRAARSL